MIIPSTHSGLIVRTKNKCATCIFAHIKHKIVSTPNPISIHFSSLRFVAVLFIKCVELRLGVCTTTFTLFAFIGSVANGSPIPIGLFCYADATEGCSLQDARISLFFTSVELIYGNRLGCWLAVVGRHCSGGVGGSRRMGSLFWCVSIFWLRKCVLGLVLFCFGVHIFLLYDFHVIGPLVYICFIVLCWLLP